MGSKRNEDRHSLFVATVLHVFLAHVRFKNVFVFFEPFDHVCELNVTAGDRCTYPVWDLFAVRV